MLTTMSIRKNILLVVAALITTATAAQVKSISGQEYWFDNDIQTRHSLAASPAQIDISALSPGVHTITMRVKDSAGLWSNLQTRLFLIPSAPAAEKTIAGQEYWFDNDIQTRHSLAASPAVIDISALSPGVHTITMRVKDSAGLWSNLQTRLFIIAEPAEEKSVVSYKCWIDDDTENTKEGTLSGASGVLPISTDQLTMGTHTLSWLVRDSRGVWSRVKTADIIVKGSGAIGFETAAVSKTYGDATFTNELTLTGDGTVTYSSDNDAVATVDAATGAVTIVGAGNAVITATVESGADYEYAVKTVSYALTVAKADGYISYEVSGVSKTYGDAAFINPLTIVGDGEVEYSTSDAAVATVDAATGEVTIVGAGEAVITASVTDADGGNYAYAVSSATYTVGVNTAAMSVVATNYTGTYDGEAHGITVTVDSPEGTEVKYGEAEGEYNFSTSPTYTNANTYIIYYKVTKPNYTTVTGSAVVKIEKAAAVISFENASVSRTYGDAAFTNPLTNSGDGEVTYASDNEAVATVDVSTGDVTITGSGEANITATVVDGLNYTYATKTITFSVGVNTAAMDIAAEGYTGTYDGKAHGITVTVNVPDGALVEYGTEAGVYDQETSPMFTDAGSYTVYYQVTNPNYTTVANSAVVSISKAVGSIGFEMTAVEKMDTDVPFTNELTISGDGTVNYASDNVNVATVNAETGEVTITGIGEATITATVTDGTNYTYTIKSARYTLKVTINPATSLNSISLGDDDSPQEWFTLGGQKLGGKPQKQGLYVRNGKKVVIK